MHKSDWALAAAITPLGYQPTQTFANAIEVAKELCMAWPEIDPRLAVQCYFAPEEHGAELIICESHS